MFARRIPAICGRLGVGRPQVGRRCGQRRPQSPGRPRARPGGASSSCARPPVAVKSKPASRTTRPFPQKSGGLTVLGTTTAMRVWVSSEQRCARSKPPACAGSRCRPRCARSGSRYACRLSGRARPSAYGSVSRTRVRFGLSPVRPLGQRSVCPEPRVSQVGEDVAAVGLRTRTSAESRRNSAVKA